MRSAGLSRLELGLYGLAVLGFALATLGLEPATAFEPGPRVPGTYRVVTWNVGGAGPNGPVGFQDEAIESVAATLRALDPDLVVLQEVADREQLRRLERALEDERGDWDAKLARRGGGGRVAALGRGDLDRMSLDLEGRALGVVHASPLGDVQVVGLHADAFDADARNREVGAAFEALRSRPATGPRILCGDFNLDLDLDKRRDLFSNDGYRDVETYNWVASSFGDAARGTGSTAEPDRRLDYVFVDPSLAVLAAGPWKGRRAGAMDHDPVVCDLRLAGAP